MTIDRFCELVLSIGLLFAAAALPLHATVVGTGTPASCTQSALQSAINLGGTVTFNCGPGAQIALTSPLTVLASNPDVTVDGGGVITLDGSGTNNSMLIIGGGATRLANAKFTAITFANGKCTTGLIAGGAIQNAGMLTLDGVTFTNNQAPFGGAIFQELCTACLNATSTIHKCTFKSNLATNAGGAINMEGGVMVVTDSTFTNNIAPSGGATELTANSTFYVDFTTERCTFNGNTSTRFGGAAIDIEFLATGGRAIIRNDTFTGNSATFTGATASTIFVGSQPVVISNNTMAGNATLGTGGAVYFAHLAQSTSVHNNIFANNSGGNCGYEAGASIASSSNIQWGDATCLGVLVIDPRLGPLTSNGGPTQTMALGVGSAAIDHGDPAFAPATDQRGNARTDGDGDGLIVPDLGAYEAAASPFIRTRRHAVGR